MNNRIWRVAPFRREAEIIASELGLSLPVAQVIVNRKIIDPESARRFLFGTLDDLYDPFLMGGMAKAIARIEEAISRGEKILIFGDYDVDGVLSAVMLFRALENLGARVDYFIPQRLKEGYGIREEHLEVVLERGVKLVVSVDCGIKATGFVRGAKKGGVDVIITDHHLPGAELPEAVAILNPVLDQSGYPDKSLAGIGVAFKLIQALYAKRRLSQDLRRFLKYVAIGTISDVAHLRGENRLLVKYGLRGLEDISDPGLKCLLEICGLKGRRISEGDVGFRIGPRINAAGRMGEADLAVRLFFAGSLEECLTIVRRLDELNARRQRTEEDIFSQALARIQKKELDKSYRILILGCEEWHRGVIGIVASKIKDAFHRPAILFSYEDGKAYGSGRSISEFSLIDGLTECQELFLSFGGHPYAVGCTLLRENMEVFKRSLNAVASARISDDDLKKKVFIDAPLHFNQIDNFLMGNLELLFPFGVGNPRPLFMAEKAEIVSPPQILQGKHVKFLLRQAGRTLEAVGWEKADWTLHLGKGDAIDLAFSLQLSTFRGEERAVICLEDFKR
jgi:single-stranded-DNA-specific exonuclease